MKKARGVLIRKTMAKALTGIALASSLYGLPVKKANAFDLITPSGFVIKIPDKQTQTTSSNNSNLYKQKKQYNWVKPNKYDNWQCAYELTYDSNTKTPDGFKLYVDVNGDDKPDYQYRYTLQGIDGFFGGATYDFELDTTEVPVGGGWKNNLYSAMNVCGIDAIKRLFYQRDDLVEEPSKYEITEMDLDIYYPQITFERR